MDVATLIALFRAEVNDGVSTAYLWSDTEVYAFADDAQKMFCRLTGGLPDATSSLTTIACTAGQKFVAISPKILRLKSVENPVTEQRCQILNYEDMDRFSNLTFGQYDYGYVAQTSLDNRVGVIRAVVSGMEPNKLRLVYIPEANQNLNLIVNRLPLIDINSTTVGNSTAVLEIDEMHHRHLILWMKALAHMKQDAETFNQGKAAEFDMAFRQYCLQAKHDRELHEHKYRTVSYGGI